MTPLSLKQLVPLNVVYEAQLNLTSTGKSEVPVTYLVACYVIFTQKSYQEPIDKEFQRRYASVVLELERLNKVCCLYLRMLLYIDKSKTGQLTSICDVMMMT